MDERLNRLSNIKAAAWVTLIIFAFLTYYIIVQIIGTIMFSNNPMMIQTPGAELDEMTEIIAEINNTAALIRIILILSGAISLLTSISAIGLLKFKRWGLILFHSSTLIILLGILFGVVYYTLTIEPFNGLNSTEAFDMAINQHFRNTQKFYTISYGVFFLLIAWIITRINILFSKKNYRVEFHP